MHAQTLTLPTPTSGTLEFDFQGSKLRTVLINGEPWFVAADVANILEYRDASNMARMCDDDERGTHIVSTPSGLQKMTVISEPGLFRVITHSRSEKVKPFQRQLFHEILPSIRKTGSYNATAEIKGPEAAAADALGGYLMAASLLGVPLHLAQIESVKQIRVERTVDFGFLLDYAPAQDNILEADVMLEPTELGRHFGLSAIKMNLKLADLGLQERVNGEWVPQPPAAGMFAKHSWANGTKSGYNMKWSLSRVQALMCADRVQGGDLQTHAV